MHVVYRAAVVAARIRSQVHSVITPFRNNDMRKIQNRRLTATEQQVSAAIMQCSDRARQDQAEHEAAQQQEARRRHDIQNAAWHAEQQVLRNDRMHLWHTDLRKHRKERKDPCVIWLIHRDE